MASKRRVEAHDFHKSLFVSLRQTRRLDLLKFHRDFSNGATLVHSTSAKSLALPGSMEGEPKETVASGPDNLAARIIEHVRQVPFRLPRINQ